MFVFRSTSTGLPTNSHPLFMSLMAFSRTVDAYFFFLIGDVTKRSLFALTGEKYERRPTENALFEDEEHAAVQHTYHVRSAAHRTEYFSS